jgi:hypothetical protein
MSHVTMYFVSVVLLQASDADGDLGDYDPYFHEYPLLHEAYFSDNPEMYSGDLSESEDGMDPFGDPLY